MNMIFIILLLISSGVFSGLTIAYMSFDIGFLQRLAKQNNKDAIAVLDIRKEGMRLLTTLILGTTLSNAFATVLIGDHFSGLVAGLVSAALIFLLADVFPQSFAARYAMRFGAFCSPIMKFLLFIFYPICQPIAYGLKKILGEERAKNLSKIELLSILDENGNENPHIDGVDTDERRIARGSLLFSDRQAHNVMTPNTVVKTISSLEILDHNKMIELRETGYSRIPVFEHDENTFIGILYLKDLIGVATPVKVADVMDRTIHFVHTEDPLDKVLSEFIETKMHLFVVLDEFGGFEGVITVEDILEEIIGQEIMDEDDDIADLRQYAKNKQRNKKVK